MTKRSAVNIQRALEIKCAVCQQQFENRFELNKHAQLKHPNDKVFKCDNCSMVFANVLSILRHNRIHKFLQNRFSCKLCSKTFLGKDYFKLHLRRHTKDRRYYCFLCRTSYKFQQSLTQHNEIHHLYCPTEESLSLENFLKIEYFPNEESDPLEDNTNTYDFQQIKTFDNDDNFILKENDDYDYEDDDNDEDFSLEKKTNYPIRKRKQMTTVDTKCAVCLKQFKDRLNFINHAQQNHPKAKAFKCSICPMVFVNYTSIARHSRIHKDTAKKHVCEYCSKSFLHRDSYRRHLQIHTREVKYSCTLCNRSYIHEISLKNHLKTHLKKGDTLETKKRVIKKELSVETKCAVCQQEFKYRQDLIKHARIAHPNDKVFKCSICPVVFRSISSLTNHRADHFNLPKKYTCEFCPKSFRNKQKFNAHMKVHSTERPYSCSLCKKTFKCERYLKIHQDKHLRDVSNKKTAKVKKIRGPPIKIQRTVERKCAVCQQEFEYRFELVKHAQQQHPNDKAFKCASCPMVFANVLSISRHFRVHKVSKTRFSCKMCTKSFFRKENAKLHLKIHKIERPYCCFVCETTFKCKNSLEKHLKNHLNNISNELNTDSECQKNNKNNLEADQLKESCNDDDNLILKENSNKKSVVDTKIERPYYCFVCETSFKCKDSLDHHMKIHLKNNTNVVIDCQKNENGHLHLKAMQLEDNTNIEDTQPIQKSDDNLLLEESCNEDKDDLILEETSNKKIQKLRSISVADTKCAVCHEQFKYRLDLINHAKQNHPNVKAFKCRICPMVFANYYSITNHRRIHKNMTKRYICKYCPKSFLYRSSYKRHINIHTRKLSLNNHHLRTKLRKERTRRRIIKKKRAVETKCAVCQQEFEYRDDLIKHARMEHPNDKVFKCSMCPMVFKNISSLTNHRADHKNLPKKYMCKLCPNSYREKQKFNQHMKSHSKSRPYSCSMCDKAYKNKNHLQAHEKTHRKDVSENKQARKGGTKKRRAVNKYLLDQHMKKHSTKRCYTCSLCEKSYKHKHSLQNHQKTHSKVSSKIKEVEIKSSRRYPVRIQQAVETKCAVCQQEFDYSFELVKHAQLNHPNGKAFKCSNCSMVFVNVLSLSRHSETHKDLQIKFSCEICCKSYERQHELKTHLRTHTKERKTTDKQKCPKIDGKPKINCENKKPKSLQRESATSGDNN